MFTTRTFVALIAFGVPLGVLTPSPLMSSLQAQVACAGGPSAGFWRLPTTSMGTGVARGRLIDPATNLTAYRLTAQLQDVPTPCLSCIGGNVQGSLDDGSGGSPDFLVRGRYLGSFMGGSGQFELRVFRPSGGPVVGIVNGSFEDSPGDGAPGQFNGTWRICP